MVEYFHATFPAPFQMTSTSILHYNIMNNDITILKHLIDIHKYSTMIFRYLLYSLI